MDAVNFSVKRAHLALQRVGRVFLRKTGLTPARFDLMKALGTCGAKQSDLWRQLEVVRSVVSEMIRALEKIGWVERKRDGRTRLVKLTTAGRAIFARVYDACVATGDVGTVVDRALAAVHDDGVARVLELIGICAAIRCAFRAGPPFEGPDLYVVLGLPA